MSEKQEFFSKLNDAADKVGELVNQHGETAIDATLALTRFHAIWEIGAAFILIAAIAIGWRVGVTYTMRNWQWIYDRDLEPAVIVPACLGGVGSIVGVFAAGSMIFDPTNWLSVYDPALGLAYKALQSTIL